MDLKIYRDLTKVQIKFAKGQTDQKNIIITVFKLIKIIKLIKTVADFIF